MKNYFYCIILIVFCTYLAACKKSNSTTDKLSGLWVCSGNEERQYVDEIFYYVWNGHDSVPHFFNRYVDTFYSINDRLIKILNLGNGRVAVTNQVLGNPSTFCNFGFGDTSLNTYDTLNFSERDKVNSTDNYGLSCQGIMGHSGVGVFLEYDYMNNKINLVYSWGNRSVSSYIRINGVKN